MTSEISSVAEHYRGKHDIRVKILELLTDGPTTRTKILYGAYLSFDQLKAHLAHLSEHFLTEEMKDGKIGITGKGRRYLKALQHADAILKESVA